MEFVVDPKGDANSFVGRYEQALRDLQSVALRGSDESEVADPALERFRSFFPPAPSQAESDETIKKWRRMSPSEQAEYDRTTRWNLPNVLYMLGPGMREWDYERADILPDGNVLLRFSLDGYPAAMGVIRQIVEFAGGTLVEDQRPIEKPRASLFRWFR